MPGLFGSTSKPLRSHSTNSGIPDTGVETTGTPLATASRSTLGIPSRSPSAATLQTEVLRLGFERLPQRPRANDLQPQSAPPEPQDIDRRKQVVQTLLLDQPGDGQYHRFPRLGRVRTGDRKSTRLNS